MEYLLSDNTVHLSSYNYITVEHILPQNSPTNSQWRKDFTDKDRLLWTNKLANLVLISQKKNSALNNSEFSEKKKIYLKKRIDAFHANKVFLEQTPFGHQTFWRSDKRNSLIYYQRRNSKAHSMITNW
ncbi:HNH endonuclease family protein [Paenibacillus lutrae]|uniref:HNH endonuclease family protein n=1 Tax=Paenibacillus lutrae TaxID=2078573 RepID=UPI0019136DE4|nr:HNH endonuclease family protein [Paenibacillus lutrae]